jgi:hypothetical protein
MPSLRALGEFKASLQNLGLEPQTLLELQLPMDDLTIPENEPEPNSAFEEAFGSAEGVEEALSSADSGLDTATLEDLPADEFSDGYSPDLSTQTVESTPQPPGDSSAGMDIFGDLGDLLGGAADLGVPETPLEADSFDAAPQAQEDIDFGNFIDSIPDDVASAAPSDDSPPDDVAPAAPPDDLPDTQIEEENGGHAAPPGLLNGLADEIEAERVSMKEDEAFDFGDIDLDVPDSQEEGLSAEGLTDEALGDLPVFETEGEPLGDIPDFNETPPEEAEGDGSGFDLGDLDLGNIDSQEEGLPTEGLADEGITAEGLSSEDFADESSPTEGLESFPDFNMDESLELPGEEALPTGEDFGQSPQEPLDISLPDDIGFEDTGAGDGSLPGFDSGEDLDIPDEGFSSFDTGDTGVETPETPPAGDEEDSFDFTEGAQDLDSEAVLEEIPRDGFDAFSPEAGPLDGDFDVGSNDDFGSLDDFRFPEWKASLTVVPPGRIPRKPQAKKEKLQGWAATMSKKSA